MQLMKEGDKWELYIPSELAYGDRNMGLITGRFFHLRGSGCEVPYHHTN